MKVIVVKPHAHIKMDSDVYTDALTEAGIDVVNTHFENGRVLTDKKVDGADLIWCPYEQELQVGLFFKRNLNIPLVGHYEWVSPWRTMIDSPLNWGYEEKDVESFEKESQKWRNYYISLINLYKQADVKTSPTDYCFSTLKELGEINFEYKEKPYIIDDKLLEQFRIDNPEKSGILTIGRLVPHKRIHHIITALSMIDNPPTLKILGYGEEKDRLVKLAKELKVNIEFVGNGQNGEKAKYIQESEFLVTPCASLPLGEASLFKVPTIMYDNKNMIEKHGDMGIYVEDNNINALAEKIKEMIENPDELTKAGEKAYNVLISGKSGLCLSKDAVQRMIKIFEEAIK